MTFIAPKTPQSQECIFCTQPAEHRDEENHILYRGEHCYMMLNRYPYNNGHLMIVPFQHVGTIEKLSAETLAELMAQAQLALKALRFAMTFGNSNVRMHVNGKLRLVPPSSTATGYVLDRRGRHLIKPGKLPTCAHV